MHSLIRFVRISRVMMRYRLDSLILSTPLLKKLKPLTYLIPWHYFPVKNRTRGERIRLALEELGPIYIKFGQTLSTRPDLLPDDISLELKKLQDSCPPFDTKKAISVIERDLGDTIKNLFKNFDSIPLASASIAQVHTATTHNNEQVVVKIVRPDIESIIDKDVKLMYALARLFNKHPLAKKIRPIEIVEEFEAIIVNELDMRIEAGNCERIGQNFSNSDLLYVPKVYQQLSAQHVLTTQRIYGTPVGDVETLKANNIDMKQLAEQGVIIFFTQVFKHNFFHADMHPGNIFVSDKGQYIGVDFGIMGTLTEEDKDFLADIFLAFFNQNYRQVAQTYIDSGWASASTDVSAFEAAVERICLPMFDKPLGEISFGQVLLDLIQEAKNFDITVQPQLLLLDKTLLNIEGLGRQLYPQLDLWATAKPFLEELVQQRYNMKDSFEKLKEQAPKLLKELPDLPTLTISALKKLDKMKDINQLHAEQTNAIVNQLKDNANRQTAATISGALAILSAILMANSLWIAGGVGTVATVIFYFKSR